MKIFAIFVRKIIYSLTYLINNKNADVIIVCYHSIGDDNWYHNVSLENFKKQVDYLMKLYSPATLVDVKEIILGRKITDKKNSFFVLTFDDGYKNILSTKEYLKSKGIKPILFSLSNTNKADIKELGNNNELLSEDDIKGLINDGWEIGSHGATHADFWKLNDEELKKEISGSKKLLESTYGVSVKYFSYPKGRYNQKILDFIKETGYEVAVSMDDEIIEKGISFFTVPRIAINKSHSFSEFKKTLLESSIKTRKFIKNFLGGILLNYI